MKHFNHKILLVTLLAVVTIAAAMIIGQLWFSFLSSVVLAKSLITLVIVGVLAGFLAAVDYDWPEQRMKPVFFGLIALAVITAGLVTGQMWFEIINYDLFGKILITLVILMVALAAALAVFEDFGSHKKLRDDKFID